MNKKNYKYYPLMLLLLALPLLLKGQEDNGFPKAEKLALFTDRSIYITGEQIHFTVFVTNHAKQGLSNILYAEIIEPDGTRIVGDKFRLTHAAAHGCLAIPSGTITGTYYLEVYTKYMRNPGPKSFAYVGLKIVNPYKAEVLEGKNALNNMSEKNSGKLPDHILKISTIKEIYHSREEVNVTVRDQGINPGKIHGACISVMPEPAAPGNMLKMHPVSREVDLVRFYPENRGLSLTGTLIDSVTRKPIAGVDVNLTIIGGEKTFMANKTNDAGHFYFSLPAFIGNRDIFIGPQNIPGKHPKILVKNDFSSTSIQLPDPLFKLDSTERILAIHMAQNTRIRLLYDRDSLHCNNENKILKSNNAFYGKPSYILKLNQYIQLPSLETYIHNLSSVINLMVRTRHGKKYIKVLSNQPDMAYLDPLLLVDGVAIDDPGKILALPPDNIARIEVVNKPYVIGDMKYGGIVNFISKKGDFAGIDLPSSGLFLNYKFLHNNCHCAITTPQSVNQPDARNTLYWNPDVQLNSENEIHFSFKTGDTPGRYAIVLQGIGPGGKPFRERDIIVVKPKH